MNEVYLHLRSRLTHHDRCTAARCFSSCDYLAFHQYLDAPLLSAEVEAADLHKQRLDRLARGDIPA